MSPQFLAALFALAAAACWGGGDFAGGLAARRAGAFWALLVAYSVGMIALAVVALASGEPLPPPADLAWGTASGLAGMMGIGFLFRGFAAGRMGLVAPVSAVLGTALPVAVNALAEGLPGTLQFAGFAVALAGIWLLSRSEQSGSGPSGLGSAVLAGLGFGGFFTALGQVGEASLWWPVLAGRVAACTLMITFALVTRRRIRLSQLPLGLLVLSGGLDVAGNVVFLLATQNGRLDVAAVLASLYPAVTTLLARLIIHERLTRVQALGVAAAVAAIGLITI
jgi:drug/metabolite transporter (DMT)-like permease